MRDDPFKNYPEAVAPAVQVGAVNDPVSLYEGDIRFRCNSKTLDGTGRVELSWLPYPAVRFYARLDSRVGIDLLEDDATIEMTDRWSGLMVDVHPTSTAIASMDDQIPISGSVNEWSLNRASAIKYVVAHIVNFRSFRGEVVKNGTSAFYGRAELTTPNWQVVIDEIHQKVARQELKASRGYAITHVCRVTRIDGSEFALADVELLIEALTCFCSFCLGQRCGVVLLTGFGGQDQQISHKWLMPRVDGYREARNWFSDLVEGNMRDCFTGFMSRFEDATWQKSIRDVLFWYCTANTAAVSIENGVVLSQIAFETLAWTLLVEDSRSISSNGFERIDASDKLRLLLTQTGIPVEIPVELNSLAAFSRAENLPDGPEVLTRLRNAYVHPNSKSRKRLERAGEEVEYQSWVLSMHYLELILLYLFEYQGKFSSRLVGGVWKGQEIREVPWSN